MKKQNTPTPSAESKTKAEEPVTTEIKQVKPKKAATAAVKTSTPKPAAPKVAKKAPAKPVPATTGMSMPERVGMTAGSIWRYLDENGSTTVVKLVQELPEEEKIIQRSIGWLAQENKISIAIIDRAETISLRA